MAKDQIDSPMRNFPKVPSHKGGTGTFGHEPGDPWSKHKQSSGPGVIPNKTRDATSGSPTTKLDTTFGETFKGKGVGRKK